MEILKLYKSLHGSLLTNKIYAGTMGYHGSTRSPILHIAQSYPVFAAKIVILHWQIFPVHPHDYENFWPSCRFFLTSPENRIRNWCLVLLQAPKCFVLVQFFCARQKDDLHSVKLVFVPAQKVLKRNYMQSNFWSGSKHFGTCKRTRHKCTFF